MNKSRSYEEINAQREVSGFKHSSEGYRTIKGVRWQCVTAGGGALLIPVLRERGIKYRYVKATDDVYCHPDDIPAAILQWEVLK